jgi:OOP family OmpA-OmpF porin
MKKLTVSLLALALAGSTLFSTGALARNPNGAQYQPVTAVPATQSQVVYYRMPGQIDKNAAHIYVDGEYQASLLPGGVNVFCVAPGNHSLGNFVNDAPFYLGKSQQPWRADLAPGKTYYVRVGNGSTGQPQLVSRDQAEPELKQLHLQGFTLSRASAVQKCVNEAPRQYKDYVLQGDVLFTFGKSSISDISPAGRRAVGQLTAEINRDNAGLKAIEVIGHTDPIGKEASNLLLGQRRAETVRQMLIDNGIPAGVLTARSAGSSELVAAYCEGPRAAKIQCNAPNRRVVVRVDTDKRP